MSLSSESLIPPNDPELQGFAEKILKAQPGYSALSEKDRQSFLSRLVQLQVKMQEYNKKNNSNVFVLGEWNPQNYVEKVIGKVIGIFANLIGMGDDELYQAILAEGTQLIAEINNEAKVLEETNLENLKATAEKTEISKTDQLLLEKYDEEVQYGIALIEDKGFSTETEKSLIDNYRKEFISLAGKNPPPFAKLNIEEHLKYLEAYVTDDKKEVDKEFFAALLGLALLNDHYKDWMTKGKEMIDQIQDRTYLSEAEYNDYLKKFAYLQALSQYNDVIFSKKSWRGWIGSYVKYFIGFDLITAKIMQETNNIKQDIARRNISGLENKVKREFATELEEHPELKFDESPAFCAATVEDKKSFLLEYESKMKELQLLKDKKDEANSQKEQKILSEIIFLKNDIEFQANVTLAEDVTNAIWLKVKQFFENPRVQGVLTGALTAAGLAAVATTLPLPTPAVSVASIAMAAGVGAGVGYKYPAIRHILKPLKYLLSEINDIATKPRSYVDRSFRGGMILGTAIGAVVGIAFLVALLGNPFTGAPIIGILVGAAITVLVTSIAAKAANWISKKVSEAVYGVSNPDRYKLTKEAKALLGNDPDYFKEVRAFFVKEIRNLQIKIENTNNDDEKLILVSCLEGLEGAWIRLQSGDKEGLKSYWNSCARRLYLDRKAEYLALNQFVKPDSPQNAVSQSEKVSAEPAAKPNATQADQLKLPAAEPILFLKEGKKKQRTKQDAKRLGRGQELLKELAILEKVNNRMKKSTLKS